MTTPIDLRIPATTANLGPGFDTLGLALKLYNRFRFTLSEHDKVSLSPQCCVDVSGLDTDPSQNLIIQAMDRYYTRLKQSRPGIHVEIEAHIPLARGLGSSSSAIAAGLVAANRLCDQPLSDEDLVRLGTELEGHPDNLAPAILGGALLCDNTRFYPLDWPDGWHGLIAVPAYPLLTAEARQVLPEQYSLSDAVFNLRKTAGLTWAVLNRDTEAFRHSLSDRLHQPYRGKLIAEFEPIRQQAEQAGAFGTVISGAGPSIAVFYPKSARQDLQQALEAYRTTQAPDLRLMWLGVDTRGAHPIQTPD